MEVKRTMGESPSELVFENEPAETVQVEPESEGAELGSSRSIGPYLWRIFREVFLTALPAVIIALLINTFVAQAMIVEGPSMSPNLHFPQRVIVERVMYQFVREPRRGDIVVVSLPGQDEPLIKRVIGLPGETVEVRNGQVFIDEELIEEEWITRQGGPNYPAEVVPPNHVFVMGDNRGNSRDSRAFGPVSLDQIVGRAWVIYWPPEDMGLVH